MSDRNVNNFLIFFSTGQGGVTKDELKAKERWTASAAQGNEMRCRPYYTMITNSESFFRTSEAYTNVTALFFYKISSCTIPKSQRTLFHPNSLCLSTNVTDHKIETKSVLKRISNLLHNHLNIPLPPCWLPAPSLPG